MDAAIYLDKNAAKGSLPFEQQRAYFLEYRIIGVKLDSCFVKSESSCHLEQYSEPFSLTKCTNGRQ